MFLIFEGSRGSGLGKKFCFELGLEQGKRHPSSLSMLRNQHFVEILQTLNIIGFIAGGGHFLGLCQFENLTPDPYPKPSFKPNPPKSNSNKNLNVITTQVQTLNLILIVPNFLSRPFLPVCHIKSGASRKSRIYENFGLVCQ